PLNRGAYYRGFHLLRSLAKEHDVDLFALSEKSEGIEHQEVFEQFCTRVQFLPFEHPCWEKLFPNRLRNPLPSTVAHWALPRVAQEIQAWLSAEHYHVVHLYDIVL